MKRLSEAELVELRERYPALARRYEKKHPPPPEPAPKRRVYDSKPRRSLLAWEAEEERILRGWWGIRSVKWLGRKLGRSPRAITARARKLGLGSPRSAVDGMSLRGFAKHSGFSEGKILNAAEHLGIHLRKSPAARLRKRSGKAHPILTAHVYSIDPDQRAALLEYLLEAPTFIGRSREWGTGKKPRSCLRCHGTERPHKARGLCGRCYQAEKRKT